MVSFVSVEVERLRTPQHEETPFFLRPIKSALIEDEDKGTCLQAATGRARSRALRVATLSASTTPARPARLCLSAGNFASQISRAWSGIYSLLPACPEGLPTKLQPHATIALHLALFATFHGLLCTMTVLASPRTPFSSRKRCYREPAIGLSALGPMSPIERCLGAVLASRPVLSRVPYHTLFPPHRVPPHAC